MEDIIFQEVYGFKTNIAGVFSEKELKKLCKILKIDLEKYKSFCMLQYKEPQSVEDVYMTCSMVKAN